MRLEPRSLLGGSTLLAFTLTTAAGLGAERPPVTFIVAGDSHFGASGMEALNESVVEQMNALPGTEYPPEMGGRVDVPRGLLFMGDMTDTSQESEWRAFERLYGLNGRDGVLKYPVFEAIGNHDYIGDTPIKRHVEKRHGSLVYAWSWDDLRLICLDMYPDERSLKWLAKELRRAGRERPLIIFFHYSIEGPYSESWSAAQKRAFAEAIGGHNVLAIFHGHFHRAGRYQWYGHDVFLPGAPRHSSHAFLVVRVTADTLAVATWDFDQRRFRDAFVKPITRPTR